jgi:hypothetical protein
VEAVDIGELRVVMRAKMSAILFRMSLAGFCLVIGLAAAVVGAQKYEAAEMAKGAGFALLFLSGGGVLAWFTWKELQTRVELCAHGFAWSCGKKRVVIRFSEVQAVEKLIVNGKLATLILYARGERVTVGDALSEFAMFIGALQARGLLT